MDNGLFHAFKTAIVLPPAEAGYQREKFIQTIANRKQLKSVKKAVKYIREDHELLYELERDWFETILALKRPSATTQAVRESTSSFELPDFGWGTYIVIAILIRILIRVMMNT